jgi:predicted nucleic acid-binding protein
LVVTALFVDSSVLIDHLRGNATPGVEALNAALGNREVIIGDLVLMEVLQGFREPRRLRLTEETLAGFPCLDLGGARRARAAASAYRLLRARGVTPRSAIDVLIAAFCVSEGLQLLASDRDFTLMAPHLGLALHDLPIN